MTRSNRGDSDRTSRAARTAPLVLLSMLATASIASAQPAGCPQITAQPTSIPTCASPVPTLTVAATGDPSLSYQWQVETFEGWLPIPEGGDVLANSDVVGQTKFWAHSQGSTTPQIAVTGITAGAGGGFCPSSVTFRCVVTNACGAATSATANIFICRVDMDCNGAFQPIDVAAFVSLWFDSLQHGTLAGDFDRSGAIEPADVSNYVGAWFSALFGSGC